MPEDSSKSFFDEFPEPTEETRSSEHVSLSWQVGSQLLGIRSTQDIDRKSAMVDDLELLLVGKLTGEYYSNVNKAQDIFSSEMRSIQTDEENEQRWSPYSIPGLRVVNKYDSRRNSVRMRFVNTKLRALMQVIYRSKLFPVDDVQGGPPLRPGRPKKKVEP